MDKTIAKITADTDTKNKLGTENLKQVLGLILLVSYNIRTLLTNFSYAAALKLAFLIGENLGTLKKGKLALAELRDLSPKETREMSDFFGVQFDLENDTLESRIEAGVEFIPEGYDLLKANLDYFTRVRGWVSSWKDTDEAKIKALPAKIKLAA